MPTFGGGGDDEDGGGAAEGGRLWRTSLEILPYWPK